MTDPMQHATSHSSLPTTASKTVPWPSTSAELDPNKRTWNELERRVRGWVNAYGIVRAFFRHLSRSGWASQRKWFTTWSSPCLRDAGQLLGLKKDPSPLTDVRATQSHITEWFNFVLDEKSVKIMDFDLNQLQHDMWWTWVLVEFSNNNSVPKQTKYAFLLFLLNSRYSYTTTLDRDTGAGSWRYLD